MIYVFIDALNDFILCGQATQGEHGCAANVVLGICCVAGTRHAARAYHIPDDGNIIRPTVRDFQRSTAAQEKRLRSYILSCPYALTFQTLP
jgi:hypothetical protein